MANELRPATAKGRATRERIVQAAAELVAEKGAAGMSLDDVRSRTGASRSQLYHYFEDRDDLVRAVVDATTDLVLGRQEELLDHLDTWSGIEFRSKRAAAARSARSPASSPRATQTPARRSPPASAAGKRTSATAS